MRPLRLARHLRLYVAGVGALAALAVVQLALVAESHTVQRPWLFAVCAGLFTLQGIRAIRRRKGSQGETTTQEEALFVLLALLMPPLPALATFAVGVVLGQATDWHGMLKSGFNIVQLVGSAALGFTVVELLAADSGLGVWRVSTVLLAVLVFLLVNRAAVSGVLVAAGAGTFREDFLEELRPDALTWAGTVSVGLLAGVAAIEDPWTFPFALAAMVALLFALSGHARARHDRQALSEIVSSSPAGIVSVDAAGVVLAWNSEMERIAGRSAAEAEGCRLWELLALRDPDGSEIRDLLAPGEAAKARLVTLDLPGQARWLMLSRAGMPDGGYAFVAQDVTDKRAAERSAHDNQDRLRLALDAGGMGWWDWDADSGEVRWSENLERIFGLEPRSFGGTIEDFLACVHPEDRERVAGAVMEEAPEDGWQEVVYRGAPRDGTVRWYEDKGRVLKDADGRFRGMSGVAYDITERKRTESLSEFQRRALEHVAAGDPLPDVLAGIVRLVEEHLVDGELASVLLLDVDRSHLGDGAAPSLPDIASDPLLADSRERALAHGLHAYWSVPILSTDGAVLGTFAMYSREARFPTPEALQLAAAATHIAGVAIERSRQEQRVAEAEEKYRRLVEQLPLAVYRFSPDGESSGVVGRVGYMSPQIEAMLGYAPSEWEEDPSRIVDALHADDRDRVIAEIARARATGDHFRSEYRMVAKDGRVVWIHDACVYVRDEDGAVVLSEGYLADVSDLKALESNLLQAQKMEAIGQLAGGVAHDFNNMMTGVIGFSELALAQLEEGSELHRHVLEIRNAGERASEMTHQLLAFSRKQVLQPQVIDVNAVIAESEKLLRRLIGEDVDFVSVLDPTLEAVNADPGQLNQVLVNLVVNARDAMPGGGKLTIETSNVELSESYAALHAEVTPGAYVQLAVSDTGTGMDEATRARIFEPFFTTKETGKGTGLGLATVFGIVKQSGGHVAVYSELGQHTTFKVYLPRAGSPLHSREREEDRLQDPEGRETVLLVEDEEIVRNLIREVLVRQGYAVLEASGASHAMELASNHDAPIHLLLTDVVMPECSGPKLAERLAPLRPDMKVLFASGYAEEAIVRHGVLGAEFAFLPKPLTPRSIALKVREVLDAVALAGRLPPTLVKRELTSSRAPNERIETRRSAGLGDHSVAPATSALGVLPSRKR